MLYHFTCEEDIKLNLEVQIFKVNIFLQVSSVQYKFIEKVLYDTIEINNT